MKLHRIVFLPILLSFSACSSIDSPPSSDSPSNETTQESKLRSSVNRIEKEFQKGDTKNACKLQVSLSKDFANYSEVSPELIKALKRFEIKCGNKLFSIDNF